MIIQTKRLIIRPVAIEDAPFILDLMNTPKWIEFIGDRNVKTVKEAEDYIREKALSQFETHGYGNNVVILRETEEKLGTCGIYHREGKNNPDIGFAFLPDYRGRGYAYEANVKLLQIAKDNYKLNEIDAYTMKENLPSRKLLERLGLVNKGIGKLPTSDEELLHYHRYLNF